MTLTFQGQVTSPVLGYSILRRPLAIDGHLGPSLYL